jgi:hypothetical protein
MKVYLSLALLLLVQAVSVAETLLSDAKIIQVTERGFVLQVGTQPLAVEDSYQTRFWKIKEAASKEDFVAGDDVHVRIKTDADPPQLREMADRGTWVWLDDIRKNPKPAIIESIDAKYLTVKFSDGSSFSYRATDKSEVKMKSGAKLGDLEKGARVFVKGRTLPNLDTFLVLVSDSPIEGPKPATPAKAVKLAPLPASGQLTGTVKAHNLNISMFDMNIPDRLVHITYANDTKFYLNGQIVKKSAITAGLRAVVQYKRDKAGRLIAHKVELYGQGG